MKRLLLLAGTDLFIIVPDLSVGSCLPGIVPFQGFIKQFMVDLFNWFITVIDIEVGACRIHIGRFELPAVMVDGAFPNLCTDRSFHILSHPIHPLRKQRAFVTFCESNAKALLTAEPSKGAVALSEGAGRQWRPLPASVGRSTDRAGRRDKGEPFEKGSLASPPKPCVSVRVDGDGLFETATAVKNIVTTVTHRHAAPAGVRPADPRDCVCSSTGSRIPATNARR